MHSEALDELLDVTLGDLRGQKEALVEAIARRTREELPSYAALGADTLVAAVGMNIDQAIAAARTGRGATDAELELAGELGRTRADEGVPVEDLLHAYRVGVTEAWSAWARIAVGAGIPAGMLVTLSERLWRWADEVMLKAAAAHHEGALMSVRQEEHERSELLRGLLVDGPTAATWALARRHGVDLEVPLVPFCALAAAGAAPDELERAVRRAGGTGMLVARAGDALMGVARRAPEVASADVLVGVGLQRPAERLVPAYALAVRIATVARQRGLRGSVGLSDVSVWPAIAREPDIGEHLYARLIAPLAEVPRLGDQLVLTIDAYLSHGQRIDDTAAALYVHRNTLRNRLRLIERLTGSDLSRTEDVVEFWWALRFGELA